MGKHPNILATKRNKKKMTSVGRYSSTRATATNRKCGKIWKTDPKAPFTFPRFPTYQVLLLLLLLPARCFISEDTYAAKASRDLAKSRGSWKRIRVGENSRDIKLAELLSNFYPSSSSARVRTPSVPYLLVLPPLDPALFVPFISHLAGYCDERITRFLPRESLSLHVT